MHRDETQTGTAEALLIEEALGRANLNALRMALYQATGDETLASIPTFEQAVWGGVFTTTVLPPEYHDVIRDAARAYLATSSTAPAPPPPDRTEEARLMKLFGGKMLSTNELRFGREELAFEDFPRDVQWSNKPSLELLRNVHCTVVGSGISGIGVAVMLKRLGIPFTVYEREAEVGGTWWTNRYPDCRVDISSHLYQFKFEKNYPWSEHFASQQENHRYIKHIAEKYGVMPHIRFNCAVVGGDWDDATSTWKLRIRDQDGSERVQASNFVFNATGQFSKPKNPDIEGLDDFGGTLMHTAKWDTSVDLSGKTVAMIGNGATGVQLMPRIAEIAEHMVVYQRTPQWVAPLENYKTKIAAGDRLLFDRIPYYWNWYCYSVFVGTYKFQHLTVYDPEWRAKGGLVSEENDKLRVVLEDYIRAKVGGDEDKFKKLLPPFAPLARRMVVDNGWYDALERDNVSLVTDRIERVTTNGVRTADGTEREFDAIILASGFDVHSYTWPVEYRGRQGKAPTDVWAKDGSRAFLSVQMPNFPNFFMFYGPNAQPRAGGIYSWVEIWTRYAVSQVVHLLETGGSSIEVTQDAYEEYNRLLDEKAKINLRGPESKGSWYVNKFGRAAINVPWLAEDWYVMLTDIDYSAFHITGAPCEADHGMDASRKISVR